jgi:hypothetical protein
MRRREFITLLGGAAAWPLAARAQQRAKVAHIGYLGLVSASWHTPRITAFRAGLRDLGYAEGKDFVIEFRWAEGRYDQLPALAAELVRLNVDVIVTHPRCPAPLRPSRRRQRSRSSSRQPLICSLLVSSKVSRVREGT